MELVKSLSARIERFKFEEMQRIFQSLKQMFLAALLRMMMKIS
jgi:hypothetical protein